MRAVTIFSLASLMFIVGSTMTVSNTLLAETGDPKAGYPTENSYPMDTLSLEHASYNEDEIICMAKNIYFEAGNQEFAGKVAVAHVVINRVDSADYPDTICDVVYEAQLSRWHLENSGKEVPLRNRCQFSWYCDGKSDNIAPGATWDASYDVAEQIVTNYYNDNLGVDITDGAMYYHANYVKPYWAKTLTRIARIGDHIFYK